MKNFIHSAARPVVCTLSAVERARRGNRWIELMRRAAARAEATAYGAAIHFADTAIRRELEELIELERACCAWIDFDLVPKNGGWLLRIKSDSKQGVATIRRMVGAFGS